MILRGEWGAHEAPYIRAILVCPRLKVLSPITFLVDSGASRTVLLDRDAQILGINYDELQRHPEGTVGIGGRAVVYMMRPVQLVFSSAGRRHIERLPLIYVARHSTATPDQRATALSLPSILGRDVLNKHEVVLNRRAGIVEIRVR